MAMGQADQDRIMVQAKTRRERRIAKLERDCTADDDDELQRGWWQNRVARGAVQALESGDERQDRQWRRWSTTNGGNRLGGGAVRIWCI